METFSINSNNVRFIASGQHSLPPLPYDYSALEPIISRESLRIHHDILHKGYVDNINKTELELDKARQMKSYSNIRALENGLAFYGSGDILHSIYWTNMQRPSNDNEPRKETKRAIVRYFGSYEAFKAQFLAAATSIFGGGWCILVYSSSYGRLELVQCENHQNMVQWTGMPILVCDMWEHAYYLQFQSNKAEFAEKWWTLINWDNVERRFIAAKRTQLF